jgi:hypothetical protein
MTTDRTARRMMPALRVRLERQPGIVITSGGFAAGVFFVAAIFDEL